jgi:hypothetical protein
MVPCGSWRFACAASPMVARAAGSALCVSGILTGCSATATSTSEATPTAQHDCAVPAAGCSCSCPRSSPIGNLWPSDPRVNADSAADRPAARLTPGQKSDQSALWVDHQQVGSPSGAREQPKRPVGARWVRPGRSGHRERPARTRLPDRRPVPGHGPRPGRQLVAVPDRGRAAELAPGAAQLSQPHLRNYRPKQEVLDGGWTPPPVVVSDPNAQAP